MTTRFPICGGGSIPRDVAEVAYVAYARKYGASQSLNQLAARGGFWPEELDLFLPGWRTAALQIEALEARVIRLESELNHALGKIQGMEEGGEILRREIVRLERIEAAAIAVLPQLPDMDPSFGPNKHIAAIRDAWELRVALGVNPPIQKEEP